MSNMFSILYCYTQMSSDGGRSKDLREWQQEIQTFHSWIIKTEKIKLKPYFVFYLTSAGL